jgi:acyl carrier protein
MNNPDQSTLVAGSDEPSAAVLAYLKELWEELLRAPQVNPDVSFFSMGGDSMLVIEMLVAVSAHFDREFEYNKFFLKPTLRTLSALIVENLKAHHDQPCG